VLGGYAARVAGGPRSPPAWVCPDRVLQQPLHTLSGGQRRRVELARILFSDSETMLLDEPTNHLDADSVAWLRDHLKSYRGGPGRDQPRTWPCSATVVNKVFYLDAQAGPALGCPTTWAGALTCSRRETDERPPQARAG